MRLVAEDGVGGTLDAAAELVETLGNSRLFFARLVHKATPEQLSAGLQAIADIRLGLRLGLLPEEIVKLGVQSGFGRLTRVGDLLQVLHETVEIGALAVQILREGLPLGRIVELAGTGLAGLLDLLLNLLLLAGEVAGLLPGRPHLLGKLAGGLALELLPGLVELLARSVAGGQGLLDVVLSKLLVGALRELFDRTLHVLPGLVQLLTSLLRLLAGLKIFDPLAGLVEGGGAQPAT